uniref:Coiled-coil alpha-helical rod protein 1 n=1 Tax=Nannospalax galili TaxID=1026970 RepID=A0A8C6W907_NANGA
MAWWCLDGLPHGSTTPWRDLWRLGPLHCVGALSPPRDRRQLQRKGNIDGWRQNLDPLNNVEMLPPSGFAGLVPPSHFQTRPLPTLPRMAPTWASDIPLVQSTARQDVLERREPDEWWCGCRLPAPASALSLEPGSSHALSQQAELISRQLQELRRLEEEVRLLRETSLQQKLRLEAQTMELEALTVAEKAGRAEAEGLRAALAGAEMVRKNLEEESQRELEEIQSLHQEQLATAQKEAELLRKQLRSVGRAGLFHTQEDLEAQVTLVESLRKYVGEQVPPEVHSQAWEPERQELIDTVQHLEHNRADLQAKVELLEVRVQSLTHMLALQEEELTRKIQPADALEPEFPKKCQSLLRRWREKVFVLMVQLKAQDLEHRNSMERLRDQVAELQEQVTAQSQKQTLLQHALQDKAAEVEVERMSTKAVHMELSRAQEAKRQQQHQMVSAEEQLKFVVSAVNSSHISLHSTMTRVDQAIARLPSLSNRLSYAIRKVHTVGGLMARKLALAQLRLESCPPPPPPPDAELSLELEQLREERNRLDAELQLSAHLIQQEVGRAREQGEAERRQLKEVAQQLEQELQQAQESLASVGQQLEATRQYQQASTEEAASLRQELTQQQEIYRQGVGGKASPDTPTLSPALLTCSCLLVVSLRQIQRKATQEKERNQELRRLQDEARKEEGQRLTRRLHELERDKNLMLATLQQEGLLFHYKQQRLLSVLPSGMVKSLESSPQPPEFSAPGSPAAALRSRESIKGSLSALLDSLQGLSEAISKEEAVCQGVNQNTQNTPASVPS